MSGWMETNPIRTPLIEALVQSHEWVKHWTERAEAAELALAALRELAAAAEANLAEGWDKQ